LASHPDYPNERLVACRNPELAKLRAHKRESLLAATEKDLAQVQAMVEAGRLSGHDKIGVRVGRVINRYKVAKHFTLDMQEQSFSYQRKQDRIALEAALDGIYVVRTSVAAPRMDSADFVRFRNRDSGRDEKTSRCCRKARPQRWWRDDSRSYGCEGT
jgi:hypothetical protein